MPQVSVITAAYNCSGHLGRAIDSVRRQSFEDWELLIVDDASTDGTPDIADGFASDDDRIKVWRQPVNRGPSVARNLGMSHAGGEWITILDADDAFRPARLERLLQLAKDSSADIVADNLVEFDDVADREVGKAFTFRGRTSRMTMLDLLDSEIARDRSSLALLKPLIRASALAKHKILYRTNLRFAEDLFLYSELLLSGCEAVLLDEALYVYTTQMGELSKQKSTATKTQFTPETRVWIANELRRLYGDRMPQEVAGRLAQFRAFSSEYAAAHRMSEYRHRGQYRSMARLMLAEPRAAVRFMKTLRPIRDLFGTGW